MTRAGKTPCICGQRTENAGVWFDPNKCNVGFVRNTRGGKTATDLGRWPTVLDAMALYYIYAWEAHAKVNTEV